MEIESLSKNQIIKKCENLIQRENCANIVTLNSLMIRFLWHRKDVKEVIRRASLIVADSIGMVLAFLLLNKRLVTRYPGIEMMTDLINRGWSTGLIGGKKGIALKAAEKIRSKNKKAEIKFIHHGYFSREEESKIINKINKMKLDAVFVGLNIPYQEIWIDKIKKKINSGIIMGVGGSFDVLSGRLTRAPYGFRITGIEWFWRMILEPWRFSRLFGLILFVGEVTWRFFKGVKLENNK
ncbi:MAG: WecB/TagA/CpsF family glycosyltransferase [Elusimicrobiota bacterium]